MAGQGLERREVLRIMAMAAAAVLAFALRASEYLVEQMRTGGV